MLVKRIKPSRFWVRWRVIQRLKRILGAVSALPVSQVPPHLAVIFLEKIYRTSIAVVASARSPRRRAGLNLGVPTRGSPRQTLVQCLRAPVERNPSSFLESCPCIGVSLDFVCVKFAGNLVVVPRKGDNEAVSIFLAAVIAWPMPKALGRNAR